MQQGIFLKEIKAYAILQKCTTNNKNYLVSITPVFYNYLDCTYTKYKDICQFSIASDRSITFKYRAYILLDPRMLHKIANNCLASRSLSPLYFIHHLNNHKIQILLSYEIELNYICNSSFRFLQLFIRFSYSIGLGQTCTTYSSSA